MTFPAAAPVARTGLVLSLLLLACLTGPPAVAAAAPRHASPLHAAALDRDLAACRGLIVAGAPIDARDEDGRTPLHFAALAGDEEIVRLLLAGGADPNAADRGGNTPLHLAARRMRRGAVEMLLAAGADVDARDARGRTPLHVMADQGPAADEIDVRLADVAAVLLAWKGDATALDEGGLRAVDLAARRGHARLVRALEPHGGPPLPVPAPPLALDEAYHTLAEIEEALLQAELVFPDLCRRAALGTSVQGRTIWALNISDHVGVEEDEPEMRYISTMHGDEILGVEMCLRLIEDLTSRYGIDPQATRIVDEIDTWIVPCMNPDGFAAQSRYNAHGVDLNRNFPDPYTSPSNTTEGREPETARIMEWAFDRSFTLAANFHTGALVANYPYDNNESGADVYTATPDDDMFIWISEAYSQLNPPMWSSPYFYHGITNGAEWYTISGGMQDWSYVYMGANEVTIELYDGGNYPPASQIPAYWDDNRGSMLAYMDTALTGVRGLVTDLDDGAPLSATVTVAGRGHDMYTDPDVGDYHRMVLPGTYDLHFASYGYDARTAVGVVVGAGDATRLDVALGPPARLVGPDGGEMLAVGVPATIEWTGQPEAAFHVQYALNAGAQSIMIDGFETGGLDPAYETGGAAPWLATTAQKHSGFFSARAGAVSNNQSSWLRRTVGGGELSFWFRVSSEANRDFFNFSVDGVREVHASGTSGGWVEHTASLPEGAHLLEWEYVKNGSVSQGSDTVWIDDVRLVEDDTTWTDVVDLTDPGETSVTWSPPAESDSAKVRVRAWYPEGEYGAWDSSDTTFVIVACLADVDGDGSAGFSDLLVLLGAWGDCAGCREDLDGDGAVGFSDLLVLLGAWGACG